MAAAIKAEEAARPLGLVTRVSPELGHAGAAAKPGGVFAGVPMLGKDLGSAAAGLATTAGSAALRRRLQDPARDCDLFARFRAGGLVPFGLTAVPEFGLALSSEPLDLPPARNPWNPDLTPGGSSGGAAGAVAAGIVAIAHATDAAGSIRVPAACCGLVGLKPSRGAMPGGPDFGNHLMGIASELVLARSVRDVAAAYDLCAGADPTPRALPDRPRIALCLSDRFGPAQQDACRTAAEALAALGCTILAVPPPDRLGQRSGAVARVILSVSLAEWLDGFSITDAEISPLSAAIAAEGRATPSAALFAASRTLAQITYAAAGLFDAADVLLSPVLSGPPPPIGHFDMRGTDPAAHFARMETMAPNAALANVAGCPALVLPFGQDAQGLPVGVQLMAPIGADRALLSLGARLSALAPARHFPGPIAGHP